MLTRHAPPAVRWLLSLAVICCLPAARLFAESPAVAPNDNASGTGHASSDLSSKVMNDPVNTRPDRASGKDTASKDVPSKVIDDIVPLNNIDLEGSYVGQGAFKIKRFDGAGAGTQSNYDSISETQASIEYGRRFHLFGQTYLRVAASYERYDFSSTNAPIPNSLQSLGGVVAVEYVNQGEVGAFLRFAPGAYYSDINQISTGNFNVPFSLGTILPIGKKVYVLVGLETNILAKYPVLPVLGLIILFTDHLRLEARPPDPRLIYSYSDALDFFVGVEILGDSYKRGSNDSYRPQDRRFNGGIIEYSELRAGGGITYSPIKKLDLDIDFAGGWDFGQSFDYYRGEGSKEFKTKGAPYARISLTTRF